MLLTHAIAGNPQASTFVYSANPADAAQRAASILKVKLSTYVMFNNTYPGFGGFLPSFEIGNTTIWPTKEFDHKVSALDNGQVLQSFITINLLTHPSYLVWAIYSLIQALDASLVTEINEMAVYWASYFIYLRTHAKSIFFHGPEVGSICAVSTLEPQTYPNAATQNYACEDNTKLLDDPYQGELMALFLYYSATMNATESQDIWFYRRAQLQAVNYTGSIVDAPFTQGGLVNYTGTPIQGRHLMPVTTQKGLYFGAQEHLKLLFLPYLDVPIVQQVMKNAEVVRTCNSALMDQTPGLFAAVNNATPPTMQDNSITYVASAGIPSAAINQIQEQDVITPYAAFATILFNRGIGLSWYSNVLQGPCMQSVYGSTDGIRRDGSAVSRIVSWETKAPILLALLGGITDFVRAGLNRDGILVDFRNMMTYEYGIVFDEARNGGKTLMGEDIALCMPKAAISRLSIQDYSTCKWDPGNAL